MKKANKRYKKAFHTKKKRSILKSRFFWFGILILVVLGAAFYLVVFASFLQIKNINITGNQKTSSEEIKSQLEERINRKVFFFNSRSIFLVDLKGADEDIVSNFPTVAGVQLKRKPLNTIEVKVNERVSIGVWCQEENCFNIDSTGVIFEQSNDNPKMIIKSQATDIDISLGKKVVEERCIENILAIYKKMATEELDIKKIILPEKGKKLVVEMEDGWGVYFDSKKNIKDQLFNFGLVLKEKIPAERRGDLEYIDLRFGTKVYFKYKD